MILKHKITTSDYNIRICKPDMVKNLVVVHYGKNRFLKSKFIKIKNSPYWVKPDGGLWTSPVDSKWSWKEWCDSEHFRVCDDKNSFKLKFHNDSKIAIIDSLNDLKNMPFQKPKSIFPEKSFTYLNKYIDFEKLVKIGIDAIWLTEKGINQTHLSQPVNLYGWDVETVLVLNKKCCFEPHTRVVLSEKILSLQK